MEYNLIDQTNKLKLKSWRKLFVSSYDELSLIEEILNRDYNVNLIIPRIHNIFKPFELINPQDVKVIIFLQSPYDIFKDGEPIANGIPTSTNGNIIQPTLYNIYKEIDREFNCDIKTFKKNNNIELGNLENWFKQGVLLLNSSFTSVKGDKKGNYNIWTPFLYRLVEYITEINPNCIFILMGRYAINLEDKLKINTIVLKTSHPSGAANGAKMKDADNFNSSDVFKKCNEILKSLNQVEINWCS